MAKAGKAQNDNGVVEFQFHGHDNRTKWESFQKAIYDPSANTFLGRTPKNWGQLFVFYTIFYIVLAALFAICMQGLFATLEDREPKWKLEHSLIGVNPGLGFRPISNDTKDGSLIWYNITNASTTEIWVELTDKFLKPYKLKQVGENYVTCHPGQRPDPDKVCAISTNDFGNCIPEKQYGYNTSSPCVFLKLNRIFDWEPDYFTTAQPGMPEELKWHIENNTKTEEERKQVWITCNGLDDVDREHLGGFNYNPRGFANYYYPFKNVKNYKSPVIAVEILNVTPNVIVSIECRAWARNIEYVGGTLNRAGSVTFEVQVDTDVSKEKDEDEIVTTVQP